MSKKYNDYKQYYQKNDEVSEPQETNVEEIDELTPEEPETKTGVIANCPAVNVRSEADPQSDILGVIKVDALIKVIDESDNYYKVRFLRTVDDSENAELIVGYIQKDYIDIL